MARAPSASNPRFVLGLFLSLFVGAFLWWWMATRSTSTPEPGRVDVQLPDRIEVAPGEDAQVGRTQASPAGAVATPEVGPAITAGSLSIRTVDAITEAPLAAVGVLIQIDDGHALALAHRTVVTDARGEAKIGALPSGLAHLHADRGVDVDQVIESSTEASVVIRIPAGIDVEGEVVDADGVALPFASIVLQTLRSPRTGHVVARADASGHFEVRALQSRSVYVGAIHPQHFPSTMEPIPERALENPLHFVLRMRGPGARVEGRVIGAGGEPVRDAVVRIGGTYGEPEIRVSRERFVGGYAPRVVITDVEGRFGADGLATGPVEFLVQAEGRAPLSTYVTLSPGLDDRVEFRLAAGVRIAGRVVGEDGSALSGVRLVVRAFDPWQDVVAISRADGGFELDGCEPARLQLRASKRGHVELTLMVEASTSPLLLVLMKEHISVGRLVDPSGLPLVGWSIRADGGNSARTADDGRFEVIDGGSRLDVVPPDSRAVFTPAIERDEAGLVLRVPPSAMPTASLRGRLLDAEGRARASCSIAMYRDGEFASSAAVDAESGAFRFDRLVPGSYALKVTSSAATDAPHWLPEPVTLRAAEERDLGAVGLDPLIEPGRLRVELTRRDGVEVEHALGEVIDAATGKSITMLLLSASDGRQQALLPGDYVFAFSATNAPWTVRPFTVSAGKETVVALDLAPATRRLVFFPWPVPEGFPTVGKVQCSVRDAIGQTAFEETVDATQLPKRFVPTLAPSRYRLELRGSDGSRYGGNFEVEDSAPSSRPIVVPVDVIR